MGFLSKDPFLLFSGDDNDPNTPPPPGRIPKNAPDQTNPNYNYKPTSTLGVNLETYFVQDIKDPVTRMQRLENALLAMHKDLHYMTGTPLAEGADEGIAWNDQQAGVAAVPATTATSPQTAATISPPALTTGAFPLSPPPAAQQPADPLKAKLAQPQITHLWHPSQKSTIGQQQHPKPAMHTDASTSHMPSPLSAGPISLTGSPQATESSPTVDTGIYVTGFRTGTHKDKIRVVFDISLPTDYTVDLDNSQKALVIDIPNAQWKAPVLSQSFGKRPVVKSLRAEALNNNRGSRVIVSLKKNTSIIHTKKYPALSGPGERIVVDLSR